MAIYQVAFPLQPEGDLDQDLRQRTLAVAAEYSLDIYDADDMIETSFRTLSQISRDGSSFSEVSDRMGSVATANILRHPLAYFLAMAESAVRRYWIGYGGEWFLGPAWVDGRPSHLPTTGDPDA